tara:strand:+ start:2553 stop:3053 length:501 start_codon:yes stop_codon:yes gene_type:complete
MIVYGIDPGLYGAIARFDLTEGFLEIHDMPIMEVNKKKVVSPQLVSDILRQQHAPVYIEKVGAMPGQGVTSMFSFGRSYGILLGCAAGLQMQTTVITPQMWMRALNCQKGKDGNRQRACEIFPAYAQMFARKKDDGRADASLLAYYGALFVELVDSCDIQKRNNNA